MTDTTEPKKTSKEIAVEQIRAEFGTNFRLNNTSRKTIPRLRHSLTTSAIRNRIVELETPIEVKLKRQVMGGATVKYTSTPLVFPTSQLGSHRNRVLIGVASNGPSRNSNGDRKLYQ